MDIDLLSQNDTFNGTDDYMSTMTSLTTSGSGGRGGGYGGRGGGGGGGGGYGRYGPTTCGYCTTSCIYKSIEVTFIIGVLANLIVIFRVIFDKRLRDPTFTAIAALAIADLVFLSINIITSIESVHMTLNCIFKPTIHRSMPYHLILSISWFAASGHVALMAILRYITLAYPIRANIILTCKRVMMMSAFVWVLGGLFMGTLTGLIIEGVIKAGTSGEFLIFLWFVVYLIPVLITASLHFAKVRMVKKATKLTATDATRKAVERMAKIVLIVIICAAVLPFPRLLYKILNIRGMDIFTPGDFKTHFQSIAQLFYLINNFINPFLYGFMSAKFRESVKDMFRFRTTQKDDSVATSDTPVSARKLIHLHDTDSKNRSNSLASISNI